MRAIASVAVLVSSLAIGLAGALPAGADVVGEVFQPNYNGAMGEPPSADARKLYFNTDVVTSETVQTDATATTAIRFLDGSKLQIGGSARVVLDKFVYDPEQELGDVLITLGKGLFRFSSGDIKNKEAVQFKTPSASLSIRGTKFIVEVRADGTTLVAVIEGQVEVIPCGGETQLPSAGQTATVAGNCTAASTADGKLTAADPAVDEDRTQFDRVEPRSGGGSTGGSTGGQGGQGGQGGGKP